MYLCVAKYSAYSKDINEDNCYVVEEIINCLNDLQITFTGTDVSNSLTSFATRLYEAYFTKVFI
jgi:hypothetical protein